MAKIGRIGIWVFLIIMFLVQLTSQAQSKKYFIITGKIIPEAGESATGLIEVMKNGKETPSIEIPKNGRFRFELEFFNEYSLNFKYPGHFNKIILVSTVIPQEVWDRDSDFPPFPMVVQLMKEFEGIDKSFALKPTGRIFYGKDIDNFEKESFISDLQFVEQLETAKSQANQVQKESNTVSKEDAQDLAAKQRNFEQMIKEADTNYQRGEYQMALTKYLDAKKLFPEKAYPTDRVAELQDLVKALEITEKQKAELEQKYKSAITRGNGFFEQKSYKEARPNYEEALQYKPGDVFANGRINEIDQLLALLEKQKQFKDLIAKADKNYQSKNYDQAIAVYNQANQIIPEDQYPQNQINLINQEKQQQSKLDQVEKDYNQNIQTASTLVQQKDYLQAMNSFKKALEIKPDSKLAKDKISEMELAIVGLETDKKYQQAIQLADKAMAANDIRQAKLQYQDALKIKGNEAYPKSKLAEIAATETNEINFNALVAKAEKAFTENNFDESLNTFAQALELKPKNPAVQKRIDELQNLKKQQASKKEYDDQIIQADKLLADNQLDAAISGYDKALSLKKTEAYPKDQIKKIEGYQSIIKKADKALNSKEYANSRGLYNEALVQIPKDAYASGKITEIDNQLAEIKKQEEQALAELNSYNEAVKNADQLFTAGNYSESLIKYKEASVIKTSESYPKKRIKDIENILDGIEKARLVKEKEYQTLIAQADKMLDQKDYPNAQSQYRKALEVKPEEVYPAGQLRKIDETLAENLRLQKEKTEQEFNKAMASADKAFAGNEFETARSGYQSALTIKSNDPTAKDKLAQTEARLAEIARMTQAYNKAISEADRQLTDKKYAEAKGKYQESLKYLPESDYPKQQIAKIDETLETLRREEEAKRLQLEKTEKEFAAAMAGADKAFSGNDFTTAKSGYQSALTIKPNDPAAKEKLLQTEAKLAEILRLTQAYNKAIADADRQLSDKKYPEAKGKYQESLQYRTDSDYPKQQIAKIDATLAENLRIQNEKTEQEYTIAMAGANKAFASNDLETARSGFQTALTIKPNDQAAKEKLGQTEAKLAEIARMTQAYNKAITEANRQLTDKKYQEAKEKYQESLQYLPGSEYPKQQIVKIDEMLAQREAEAKTQRDFDQALADGEALLKKNELAGAKDAFMKAYNLIPSEPVPPKRISEINGLLADQARKDADMKAILAAYQNAIQRADKNFSNKEYGPARLVYNEALQIKPDEKYPEDQLALIEKLMIEQNEQQYKTAITRADNAFNTNQFDDAISGYNEALKFKKNDEYASRKLKDIDQKMADIEAEKRRLKNLEDQYKLMLADAATDFKNKEYPKSKEKYQKATGLKPAEAFPKEQIAKIDEILSALQKEAEINSQYTQFVAAAQVAFGQNKLKEARATYQKAYNLKPFEPLPPMRIAEIDRMLSLQEETAQLAAQEEAQRLAKEKADRLQFEKAVAAADKAFSEKLYLIARTHYTTALSVFSGEKYPKDQIAKIDDLLSKAEMDKALAFQKAQQDSMQKAKDKLFDLAMASAKEHEQNKRYQPAIQKYEEAIRINSSRKGEIQPLIIDIQAKIQLLAKQDADYQRIIKLADGFFVGSKLGEAITEYQNALAVKPDEVYPQKQIKDIQATLDARDESYNAAIKKGDQAFDASEWLSAKTAYTEALAVKPDEVYPADRLKEVNQKIADANLSAKSKIADDKAYNEAMAKAEKAFKDDQLSAAHMQYHVALTIKPDEKLPAEKIKTIEDLLEKRNKDRLAQSQREIDEKYKQAISVADNSFKVKAYPISKLQYQQALLIKPEEAYPKSQMALIDKLLSEVKPAETYTSQITKPEPVKPVSVPLSIPVETAQATEVRAKSYTTITDYDEAIKKADDAFGVKDYSVARFFYLRAGDIKPTEEYPPRQLVLIHKLIDSQLSDLELSGYDRAIGQADAAFGKMSYGVAKFYYYKALEIKSWEKYPKDRINEILALTHSLLSEKEEKEYKGLIAKADEAFYNKDVSIARFYYNRAISMKKDEQYPRIKMKDIQKLIEQSGRDEENVNYQNLIGLADQAMQLENFSMARFNYNKALSMRPDEKYPKDQLKRIKESLEKQNK